ncbi:rho GTPase-activating protein 18-like [Babylonia areolata]|uniref:rho GTPase-activating protein 18-like n=1 Tax=Babylonia areolata TaxID=304850 RepID=UPI003FD302A2
MAALGQGHGHGGVMEDYWREFQEIEQNKDGDLEEDELPKTPDEGEQEAQWLKDAGYDFIVRKVTEGQDMSDDELEAVMSSLTGRQAEAVRRRVNTLTTTMRRKRGATKHLHVKDIFPTPDNSSPEPPSPSSIIDAPMFPSGAEKTPSRQRPSSFLHRKGGYKLEGAGPELSRSMEQGVEALSFRERGTFHRQPARSASSRANVSMPAIQDAEITVDFHLEQRENHSRQQRAGSTRVDLPLFEAKNDPLGVTFISDLAEADIPKIRSLALIELTALFDLYDITYSRAKRKKKARDHGLFGVPLHVLLEHDQKRVPGVKVPLVFQALVTHLQKEAVTTEGILRVPGSVTRVKQLRHELEEKFYQGSFYWEDVMPHDCAGLLKMFLRELPVPLLTYDYLEAFPQVENIPKALEQLKALNLLVLLLPTEHREVLKMLLQFLRNIVSHSDENRMGLNNICMIMAPNLFLAPAPKGKVKAGGEAELAKAAKTSSVVKMLIHYEHVLWMISGDFLTQVRHQNKTGGSRKGKDKMRLFKKKDRSEANKKPVSESDAQNGIIRVLAPEVTRNPYVVQLDDRLTAGDIVDCFRRDFGLAGGVSESRHTRGSSLNSSLSNSPSSAQYTEHRTYLYEVGGNIGERCLDPRTRMRELYHVNPTADWVIRFNVDR